MKLSASFLGSKDIPNTLRKLSLTDIDYIHVDIMDGKYVDEITKYNNELLLINNYTKKRLDIHLMVKNPLKLIDLYASLNIYAITFHYNIDNLDKCLERCKLYGIKTGIAINPKQDLDLLDNYLDKIDIVLLMGVFPGKSGQEFIQETLNKINKLKDMINKRNLNTLISVDGGINLDNIKYLKDVDIIVSGSTIINSNDYQDTITKLRTFANL